MEGSRDCPWLKFHKVKQARYLRLQKTATWLQLNILYPQIFGFLAEQKQSSSSSAVGATHHCSADNKQKATTYFGVRKVTTTSQRVQQREDEEKINFPSFWSQPRRSSTLRSKIHYFMKSSIRTKLLCTCFILTSKQWHNFHMKG